MADLNYVTRLLVKVFSFLKVRFAKSLLGSLEDRRLLVKIEA
jgi:hypothetical protein